MLQLFLTGVLCVAGVDDKGAEVWHCAATGTVTTSTIYIIGV